MAALVWDGLGERMLLCCNQENGLLTIWRLTDAGWELVAQGEGSFPGALSAAYDPSSKVVRIIDETLAKSWTLAGAKLTPHRHRAPGGYATHFIWDPAGRRLLASCGGFTYTLVGKTWKSVKTDSRPHFLLVLPKLGLVGVDDEGVGAKLPRGKAGDVELPLGSANLFSVASSDTDGSVLAVTDSELRVVRDGKVAKKTKLPLDATTCAWAPQRNVYVIRSATRRATKIWTYAPRTAALTELSGPSANKAKATTTKATAAKATKPSGSRPVWLLEPGKGGHAEDRIANTKVRGLEQPWPKCDCGKLLQHCITVMNGPGLSLKKHEGIAVFFCGGSTCSSWEPNSAANRVVFVGSSTKALSGPAKKQTRAFTRVASDPETAGDRHGTSLESKLGGHPRWLQSPESVACSTCGEPMSFALQLGEEMGSFGDAGIGYIFLCPREHAGAALWQSM